MADGTAISWSDATWNPLLGCSRVSAGCDGCYAVPQSRMRAANPHPKIAAAFAGLTVRREDGLDWTGRVNELPDRLQQPLKWRKPKRIFVNSLSDLFYEKVSASFIADVFAVMSLAERHSFQLLTKRHGRMKSLLNNPDFQAVVNASRVAIKPGSGEATWPLPNLWLGVSVEDQQWADIRIPALLATPAAVHWISAEPLLGPVDLSQWLGPVDWPTCWDEHDPSAECSECIQPDWIVAGGESGPSARPMHPDWARSLRDQCAAAGSAFHFKQWGEWAPTGRVGIGNCDPERTRLVGEPDERGFREEIRRAGKKVAGRELDGRVWDEYPQSAEVRHG